MNVTKLKTAELSGIALDWAIARLTRSEGQVRIFRPHRWNDKGYIEVHQFGSTWSRYDPSTTIQGNALIDEHKISTVIEAYDPSTWRASNGVELGNHYRFDNECHGDTRLIAAMRCICLVKYGEEIEVPAMLVAGPLIEREILNEQSQVATFSYVRTHLPTGVEYVGDFNPSQDSAFGDLDAVPPAMLRAKAESMVAKWNREQRDTYSYRLVIGIPTLTNEVR